MDDKVLRLCSCGRLPATLAQRLTPRSYLTLCAECGGGRWVEAVPATIEVRLA